MTKLSPLAVIGGIVALVAIAAGLIVGLDYLGKLDSNTIPLVTVILGMVATTVTSLLALLRVDQVRTELQNGLIKDKVKDAINEVVADNAAASIETKEG